MLLSAAWSVGFNSDVEPLSKLWIRVSSAATPATILARLACAAARFAWVVDRLLAMEAMIFFILSSSAWRWGVTGTTVLRNKYYCAIQACDAKLIMTGYIKVSRRLLEDVIKEAKLIASADKAEGIANSADAYA